MRSHVITPAHYLQRTRAPPAVVKQKSGIRTSQDFSYSMPKSLRWEPSSLAGKKVTQSLEVPSLPKNDLTN